MTLRATKLARKARKSSISVVKMANIQRNKLAKQGYFTKKNRPQKKRLKRREKQKSYHDLMVKRRYTAERIQEALMHIHPLSSELEAEDFVEMLDEEELRYMLRNNDTKDSEKKSEDEEMPYKQTGREFPSSNKIKLLPIKTDTGIIEREIDKEEIEKPEASESDVKEEEEEEEDNPPLEELPPEKSTADMLIERQIKLKAAKIKIGCQASSIIENSQLNAGCLKNLNNMLKTPDPDIGFTLQKYSALSMLEVFHNLIPNYRLTVHNESRKVTKELKAIQLYENELNRQYKAYLLNLEKILEKFKKNLKNSVLQQVAEISLRCLCELLYKHPHFNYASNIIQVVVPYLTNKVGSLRQIAFDHITKILKADKNGALSLEIIEKIDKLVRRLRFGVHPDCLAVLLSLRIKHIQNLDTNTEVLVSGKTKMNRNQKLIKKLADKHAKKPSRKQIKEKKKIARLNAEIKVVLAKQDTAKQNKQDTEVIEVIFGLYIHILKRRPNKKLIGVVLEGLAKFAHLINVEFFSDLLEVLALLMEGGPDLGFTLSPKESLHCIQTVLTILSGQGEVLNLDPHRFYVYLYSRMFNIDAVKDHENIIILLDSCRQLLVHRKKKISSAIVNAFTKRLCTVAMQLLHHGCLPILAMVRSSILTHSCVETILDTDPEGSTGNYRFEATDPLHSNAAATCLWELHTMSRHYHPVVGQVSRHLTKGAPIQGQGSIPFSFTKLSSHDIYKDFDPKEMKLKPAIQDPESHMKSKNKGRKVANMFCLEDEDWYHTVSDDSVRSIDDTDFYKSSRKRQKVSSFNGDFESMDFTETLFKAE